MPEDQQSARPIHFAGAVIDRYRHVCAFFTSVDEEQRVMAPFVREGIERGERAFHIVDPALREDYLRWLEGSGIPIGALLETTQFELRTWEEAYLRGGHFDQNRMLALIEQVLNNGPRAGFPLTRLVAHMEWALEDRPGVDDLIEYEARLNYLLPKYKDPVI
jgi:MEDS: MEthanogen/methylotroph, DcmR Sensory domain